MRLFVCDPVCVQAFGHNVSALNYFTSAFRDLFAVSSGLCCVDLPGEVTAAYGFVPSYHYYYQAFMPVDVVRPAPINEDDAFYADRLEALATADAARLLKVHSIGSDDVLFFPSLDFYGVAGLINVLRRLDAARQPRVFLRFIGVMENASHSHRDPGKQLLKRIADGLAAGMRISVSAETPRLADRIAHSLRIAVSATPYPTVAEFSKLPAEGPFVCFCPGSSRMDKGYLVLNELFKRIRIMDPHLNIRFVLQELPDRQAANHESYTSQLYAVPGVVLLPTHISESEMARRYRQASVVLLPYDKEIYDLRGSAAMMEAASFGRPVIALDGPAFAEQIRYYRLGKVVASIDEMAAAVLAMSLEDLEDLSAKALQSRYRFTSDASDAYRRWFKESL